MIKYKLYLGIIGGNQWNNRLLFGALENSIMGTFLNIMWKGLPTVAAIEEFHCRED